MLALERMLEVITNFPFTSKETKPRLREETVIVKTFNTRENVNVRAHPLGQALL
jgi:hypothetical protein